MERGLWVTGWQALAAATRRHCWIMDRPLPAWQVAVPLWFVSACSSCTPSLPPSLCHPLRSSQALALPALALVSSELFPAIRFPGAVFIAQGHRVAVSRVSFRLSSPGAGSQHTSLLGACQGPAWSCRNWHARHQET